MADVLEMPKLGFDMAEGTLVRWVKAEGDQVSKGDVVAEIETDKATVEVETSFTGVMRRHLVPQGEIVPVGTPIAVIGSADEPIDDLVKGADGGSAEKKPKTAGENGKAKSAAEDATPVEAKPEPDTDGDGMVKASPLAKRMAREAELDLSKISGSGPGGRVVKKDVEEAMRRPAEKAPAAAAAPATETPAKPAKAPAIPALAMVSAEARPDKRIPVSRLRSAIGRRMVESKNQVPHFYVTTEYDMAPLMEMREQINKKLEGSGEKLSVNDFIVKAVALTLLQFPNLNAALQGNEVVQYGAINIGVAVAVDNGLLTVVSRNADQKSLRQISAEVRELAGRARDGKVRPDDIEGSTFSISNLGMFDVEHFLAIINPPEAGILAIGSVLDVPVVKDGQIVPGKRMKATISVDHRVSDGAEGARFMQALKGYLEEPLKLLL